MSDWVAPDTHGWVHHPVGDADWKQLLARYNSAVDSPLARVFAVARAHRCRTVVEENRYVDPDYRSEYSAFWSQRFPARPAFARRLHFFRRIVRDEQLHRIPANAGYLGYSTLKPIQRGRVGRTVLEPPPRLAGAVLTLATDSASLFGNHLEVTGVPFLEQDTEYLRCAHAAAWICHYHAALRGLVGRQLTARLVELSPTALWHERALPSPGLTLNQLQAVFAATGQPALFYGLSRMPDVRGVKTPIPKYDQHGRLKHPGLWDTRIFSVVCRYLNAGFPVLVSTTDHAFVLVGWFKAGTRIRFVARDDQWGPYETITSPFTDRRAPWKAFMVPPPPKVYLSGESAESTAHLWLRAQGARGGVPASWQALAAGLTTDQVSLRTFLRSNRDYKSELPRQSRGDDVTRLLRLARLPHWVWVVEAQLRGERATGKPAVIAEVVFDSTSSDRDPRLDALSLPGASGTFPPDDGARAGAAGTAQPWSSHINRHF
jgi:hypothetical protein